MEITSAAQLKEAISRNSAAVVHCRAEWSEPCNQMDIVMKELASMHPNVQFFTVDLEKVTEVQKEYSVQAVPHFLFFKSGALSMSAEGADPSVVVQNLEELTKDLPKEKEVEEKSVPQRIEELIASADVMLFMKGSPEVPRCGFSAKVANALKEANISFSTFDILQDETMRQGLKEYTKWPTFPQLYAKSEFLGGCDIIMDLKDKGQLAQEIVNKAGEGVLNETPSQRCERMIKKAPVMLFMKGSPNVPRCKFSTRVVAALKEAGVQFSHFDILEDEAVRQELKNYSQWPTYPQLYANGDFLGGCDIIEEMHSKGELKSTISSHLS